tara:strand:- start:823 stop:1194 length:372 start_codon:yes stop_codon:yes gene_type:complete
MPDINTINGLVLCDETNVNGVTLANIDQIDGLEKSCGTCNTILLGAHTFSCGRACLVECSTYYVDKDVSVSPLGVGDHIYDDSGCECNLPEGLIYFSNKCGLRSGICYTVNNLTCEITNTSDC